MRQHESEEAAIAFHLERADARLAELQAKSERLSEESAACGRAGARLFAMAAVAFAAVPMALLAYLAGRHEQIVVGAA